MDTGRAGLLFIPARKAEEEEQEMPEPEPDLCLQRFLSFADGASAIAVALLAAELVLPGAAADRHGSTLLQSL